MNNDLAKDRLITHAITNYLVAAYQGNFAALNLLSQLEHPEFREAQVEKVQHNLGKAHTWTTQLYEDECLFSASWTQAETFESQKALRLLEDLKPDLYQSAASASRILSLTSVPSHEDLSLIMSLHARHAYSRDTYIRGFLEYAERFSLPDMQRRYQAFIPETELEVQRNKEMVNIFRSTLGDRSILPQQFFPLLFQATLVLPAFFRSHIHDINQLLSQFKGGLTWATAEFTKAESELWSDAGLNPSSAGYFRAFSMGPDEAGAWRNSGVFEANTAIDWKKGGFNPDSARPWIEQKIPPPLAFVWSMSQYSPEEAKALLEQGTVEPPPRSAAPTKKEKTIPVHEMPKKMSFPKKV